MVVKFYSYDRHTGELLAEGDADPSPLEQGKHLIPAFATTLPPPAANAGERPVYDRLTGWRVVPDARGIWYGDAGAVTVVARVGDPAPAGCLREPPPGVDYAVKDGRWVPDAAKAAARAASAIREARDRRCVDGVAVQIGGVDRWFQTDLASRVRYLMLAQVPGAEAPDWQTMDGTTVVLTAAVLRLVLAAVVALDSTVAAVARVKTAAAAVAVNPAAEDVSAGWPARFMG